MQQKIFNVTCDGKAYSICAEWRLKEGWCCSFSYMEVESIAKCIAEIFKKYVDVTVICFSFFKAKYCVTSTCNTTRKVTDCIKRQIGQ